jgi:hypothetical protein
MSIIFSDLKRKVLRALSDEPETEGSGDTPLGGNTYSAALLEDAIHAALDAITVRIWKPSIFTVDGGLEEEDLPDDLLDVEAVYDETAGIAIPKLSLKVGESITSSLGNAWTMYPSKKLTFINELGTSGATVYYSALWAKPSSDSEEIEAPMMTLTCLILYAVSYCLLVDAVASGNLANYKTKVDSGQPTDNPAKEMGTYILKRFEVELQRLPMLIKGQTQ